MRSFWRMMMQTNTLLRARLGTMSLFFIIGALYASWGLHVPTIKEKFALSDIMLAVALFMVAAGPISIITHIGVWVERWGAHGVYRGRVVRVRLSCAACMDSLVCFIAAAARAVRHQHRSDGRCRECRSSLGRNRAPQSDHVHDARRFQHRRRNGRSARRSRAERWNDAL